MLCLGEVNSFLEVELLNLLFHAQGDDTVCTEAEVEFLEHTNVWEILSTRRVSINSLLVTILYVWYFRQWLLFSKVFCLCKY